MELALYLLARAAVGLTQALPLKWVARLGRGAGGLVYWLDARHRRVARRNLDLCFGQEKSPAANPRPGPRKLPAHRREFRLRRQDGRDEPG